jgi:hypothetical protein
MRMEELLAAAFAEAEEPICAPRIAEQLTAAATTNKPAIRLTSLSIACSGKHARNKRASERPKRGGRIFLTILFFNMLAESCACFVGARDLRVPEKEFDLYYGTGSLSPWDRLLREERLHTTRIIVLAPLLNAGPETMRIPIAQRLRKRVGTASRGSKKNARLLVLF